MAFSRVYTVRFFAIDGAIVPGPGQHVNLFAAPDDGFAYILRQVDCWVAVGSTSDSFRLCLSSSGTVPDDFSTVLDSWQPGHSHLSWEGRHRLLPGDGVWAYLDTSSTGPDNFGAWGTGWQLEPVTP